MISRLLTVLLFSQIFYLGVFSLSHWSIYVVNETENLCGEFTRGNSEKPNWLQDWWKAIKTDEALEIKFFSDINCESATPEKCCKSQWYRSAGVPVWIEKVSGERKASEFLASKKIIESHSLSPISYNLDANISRKEVMKVISNASGIIVKDYCNEVFIDVQDDWGCKYIESALDNEYIAWNEKFRPNDNITKTEALKLIFKAREIEKSYETSSWQEDYISTALYIGLIDEKYWDYNSIASRGWIFLVLGKTYSNFENY